MLLWVALHAVTAAAIVADHRPVRLPRRPLRNGSPLVAFGYVSLTTTAGGLAMLLGFVPLGDTAGTYRISELVAAPPAGSVVTFAMLCVLLGASAKSAQVPFHGWLPAAMVAPRPVSAYLHAAATVSGGSTSWRG